MHLVLFGSSLVSSYWNGAATYYRGILRAMYERGHTATFYEPDAYDRQQHRDMPDPEYARVVVYDPADQESLDGLVRTAARDADLLVKCSGVGVNDPLLERLVSTAESTKLTAFWDVDAPATLDRMGDDPDDPFRGCVPRYDLVLTYGGGQRVIDGYASFGARRCVPIYNALDPTTHHPVEPDPRFKADLAFLGNRLPDREARVEEFFFKPLTACPEQFFLLGGSGWDDHPAVQRENVRYLGHVGTVDHNAFNATPLAVLNISRESMARYGYSPATRVFEAAGAGARLITDAWEGVDAFLTPGEECLVANDGDDVARHVKELTPDRARAIGAASLQRVLREHTYAQRAAQLEALLQEELAAV